MTVRDLKFTTDDCLLFSVSDDMHINIYDAVKAQRIQTLTGHLDWITSIAIGVNNVFATTSADHTIKLWDIAQRKPIETISGIC